jgi:ABC-type bacteriocin/lantibiotic exporter with double-glycine peptidase domain
VLVIGLVTIGIFEAILGGLRTYLFAHSTNRIDVELGARLFRHLIALRRLPRRAAPALVGAGATGTSASS